MTRHQAIHLGLTRHNGHSVLPVLVIAVKMYYIECMVLHPSRNLFGHSLECYIMIQWSNDHRVQWSYRKNSSINNYIIWSDNPHIGPAHHILKFSSLIFTVCQTRPQWSHDLVNIV